MNLSEVKTVYGVACISLGLLVLSPALVLVLEFPDGERLTEFWILGPGLMAQDYPYNVSEGSVYRIDLGIVNHRDGLQYYLVYLKFANEIDSPSRVENRTPSPLLPVSEYRVFLEDGQSYTREVDLSFSGVTFEGDTCTFQTISINNQVVTLNKTATWNEEQSGYYFQPFFELWSYDVSFDDFTFTNRTVWLWMNMTGGM